MDSKVARYFDAKAPLWLEMEQHTRSPVQPAVALMAGVGEGSRVLDVGCGLGVMIPVYRELGAAHVLGVDVSAQMIERARARWEDYPDVEFAAVDVAHLEAPGRFDSVVVYNAYPHIMDRPAFIASIHRLLTPHGRVAVAHGTGRESINRHHEAVAHGVSLGLASAERESAAWNGPFVIDAVVDTPAFYAFAGEKADASPAAPLS